MNLDPRHLFNLLAVMEHGSFSKAAVARGLSQPALSNSIAILERQIGAKLLERSRRGVVANPLGESLARRARELRAVLENAAGDIHQDKVGNVGALSVGVTPSMLPVLLTTALARLMAETPNVAIDVFADLGARLQRPLDEGRVDLVLGPLPSSQSGSKEFIEELLLEDPFVLLVSQDNRLARRRSVSIDDVIDNFWILPQPDTPYYAHLDAILRAAGHPWPTRNISTNSLPLFSALLGGSQAVALGSRLQIGQGSSVRAVPLKNVAPLRVGLRHRRGFELTPLALRLVAHLRNVAADHATARG